MIVILDNHELAPLTLYSALQVFPHEQILVVHPRKLFASWNPGFLALDSGHSRIFSCTEYFRQQGYRIAHLDLESLSPRFLHAYLSGMAEGLVPVIRGGTLVQKSFREAALRLPQFMRGACMGAGSALMYRSRRSATRVYPELDVDMSLELSGGLAILSCDVPWDESTIFPLLPELCWKHDPLIDHYFVGHDLLKHAWLGEEAFCLDYVREIVDPEYSYMGCMAAPLERYYVAAQAVHPWLKADTLETIRRHAERSLQTQPLRCLYAPSRPYYERYAPAFEDESQSSP